MYHKRYSLTTVTVSHLDKYMEFCNILKSICDINYPVYSDIIIVHENLAVWHYGDIIE